MLTTRRLGRTESVLSLLFWMIAGQFALGLIALPFVWEPVELRHWPLLVALAVLNLLGQLGLVRAFANAPPSVVAPFEYSALLWAAALGFVVFGDVPSPRLWAGAVIIIGAGLFVMFRGQPVQDPVPLPGQSE
jgi:drug/metabolite transporter (DMT)-like permease